MALLEAVVGASRDFLEKRKREKEKEIENAINYIEEVLIELLDQSCKRDVQDKIKKMYDDRDKFESLNSGVERLVNFIMAGNSLVENGKMTKQELRESILVNKKKIENILGLEIKLTDPIEDFLKETD